MSYNMSDIEIFVETEPSIVGDELRGIFEACGDVAFHGSIKSAVVTGEAPANVAPGNISIQLDDPCGGTLEGMAIEASMFLEREFDQRHIDLKKLQVVQVPDDADIEAAIDALK